jgi:oxygen-dependent protoporphyrinogen oxidase
MIYIIGAGISGLVSAYQASKEVGGKNIVILEKDTNIGGALRGVFYPEQGMHFDNGTHIFRMTGIAELDQLLINCIGDSQVVFHDKVKIGAVYTNKLQENSHYPDIRKRRNLRELQKDIFDTQLKRAGINKKNTYINLFNAAYERFGALYSNEILLPALSNLFRSDPNFLSSNALDLSGLSRCIAFSEDEWKSNSNSTDFRSVFGYPNQDDMPIEFENKLKQFYSKENGTNSLIIGLKNLLEKAGVKIETGVIDLQINQKANTIIYKNQNGTIIQDKNPIGILLANGLLGSAIVLGIPIPKFQKTPRLAMYHIGLDCSPKRNLAYFCNFNHNYSFFRATNYKMLTNNCKDNRITVEILVDNPSNIPSITQIINNLKDINFLDKERVSFCEFAYLKSYYPYPDLTNTQLVNTLKTDLTQHKVPVNICSFASHGGASFFQNNVVALAFEETAAFIKSLK